jgi:hypothetical protein
MSSERSFPFRFSGQSIVRTSHLSHACYVSRPSHSPWLSPIQWVPGALSLGVKRQGREAHHSPQSNAEVKECVELYLHSQYAFMAWCLVKHRDNVTLHYLYLYL